MRELERFQLSGEVIDAVDLVRSVVTGDPLGIITSLVGLVTPGVSGKSIKFGKEVLQEVGISGVDDFVKASKKALKQVDADEIARLSSNGVTKADIQESLASISKEARLKKRAIKNMSDAEFTKTYGYSRQARKLAELKQDYVTQHDWAGSDKAQDAFNKAEKTRKGLQTRYDKKEVKSKTILDQFGREKPRKYTPLTDDDIANIDNLYGPYKVISDIEGIELIQTGGLYPVLLKQAPGQLKTISFDGLSYKTSKAVDYPSALSGVKTVKGGVNKQAESYLRSGSNPTRTLAITDVKDPITVGTSYASRPGAITLVRASGGNLNYFNYF